MFKKYNKQDHKSIKTTRGSSNYASDISLEWLTYKKPILEILTDLRIILNVKFSIVKVEGVLMNHSVGGSNPAKNHATSNAQFKI